MTNLYEVSNGNMLYPTQTVKDLGVTVSADLSWTPHVNRIAERAGKVASWVLSEFKTRDKATMMTIYKSLVRSHLEYCCPLWNCSKNKDIQQLEGIQRTFTSKIDGTQHLNYWQRLKALDLMSLQRRRERYWGGGGGGGGGWSTSFYLILPHPNFAFFGCPNEVK